MKQVVGVLAMIVGVLGICASLGMIGVIWWGQSYVNGEVVAISVDVDGILQRVNGGIDELEGVLQTATGRVRQVNDISQRLAQSAEGRRPAVDALLDTIDRGIGADYQRLRELYATLRERVVSLVGALQQIKRFIPNFPVPEELTEDLQAIDQRLRELDSSLSGLRTEVTSRESPIEKVLESLASGTSQLVNRVETLATTMTVLDGRVEKARQSVRSAGVSIQNAVTLGAAGLTVFCLYVAVLHLALFWLGKSWFRPASAPNPSSSQTIA